MRELCGVGGIYYGNFVNRGDNVMAKDIMTVAEMFSYVLKQAVAI